MDTTDIVEAAANVNVVALTPAEMVPAQHALIAWCDRKIQALKDEGDELELHQKLAIEHGWKTSVVTASVNRTARRITYYGKMRAALEAGYLLVPNMPVDVLAVRVKREKPSDIVQQSEWRATRVSPQLLPEGEGRYVDDAAFVQTITETDTVNGKEREHTAYFATGYDEVDFPIALTKPVVLDAVGRAMALKIFDEIGRVQNGGGRDPIYVGRLLDPRRGGRVSTFFLAWWIDTRSL